jgi:hypothetical protein
VAGKVSNGDAAGSAGLPRRFRWPVGIGIAVALYAVAGFVVAPWAIERQLPQIVRAELGREATVARSPR